MKLVEADALSATKFRCACGELVRIRRFTAELYDPAGPGGPHAMQNIHMAECCKCDKRRICVYPAVTWDGEEISPEEAAERDLMNSAEWAAERVKKVRAG